MRYSPAPARLLLTGTALLLTGWISPPRPTPATHPAARKATRLPTTRHIVLVHGALVDGSVWRGVYNLLVQKGYQVTIVQNPLSSLADDVAATRRVLDRQTQPVVLVGQSYGGTVITAAGAHPQVKALVYVAALAPDQGESTAELNARYPTPSGQDLKGTADGYYYYEPAQFRKWVAADAPAAEAAYLAAAQVYTQGSCFTTKLTTAAWRTKPSYGIVAQQDLILQPALERFMYQRAKAQVTEVAGSHLFFVAQPQPVVQAIEAAAQRVE